MKHLSLILIVLFSSMAMMAQKSAVSSADYELEVEKPDFDKAKSKIDAALEHEKTKNLARTYLVKSRVYRSFYENKKQDGKLLDEALESIKKADELDIKGDIKGKKKLKLRSEIIREMELLRVSLVNSAVGLYKSKDYKGAHYEFVKALSIDDMDAFKSADVLINKNLGTVDTAVIFNTGVTGYYAYDGVNEEMAEPTIKYLKIAKEYKYGGDDLYKMLLTIYRDQKDTVAYVDIMKQGMITFPEEPVFLRELVAFYVKKGDAEPALLYLTKAIEQDPNNATFWFAKGTFHDQMNEVDKAIECYQKILDLPGADNGVILDANYNLGVLAFNVARDKDQVAKDEEDYKKYKTLDVEASKEFEQCLPYFTACINIDPANKNVLDVLKKVYYRLTRYDQKYSKLYKETSDQLKSLE